MNDNNPQYELDIRHVVSVMYTFLWRRQSSVNDAAAWNDVRTLISQDLVVGNDNEDKSSALALCTELERLKLLQQDALDDAERRKASPPPFSEDEVE